MQVKKNCIKNSIDEAALSLFSQTSYEKVSMRQIAQQAHITVGNIYRYYGSKDELFEALVLPTLNEIKEMIVDESMEKYVGSPNQYTNFVKYMIDLFLSIHNKQSRILEILINGCEGSSISHPKDDIKKILSQKMLPLIDLYKKQQNSSIDTCLIADLLSDGLINHFISILYAFDNDDMRREHMYEITKIYTTTFMDKVRFEHEENVNYNDDVSVMGL